MTLVHNPFTRLRRPYSVLLPLPDRRHGQGGGRPETTQAFVGAVSRVVFDDFVDRVGITEAVAAARLKELTAAGLLHKVPYREPGSRTRHEYRLTPAGTDFAPVIMALYRWGAEHLLDDGAPLDFRHIGCEAPVHVDIVCDEGHRVSVDEVHVVRPPRGAPSAQIAPDPTASRNVR